MKIKYFRIFLLVFLAIPFIDLIFVDVPEGKAQSSQVWSTPINLSNSGSTANPSMVVDTQGITHVFWVDEFDGYKYVNSVDGVNWSSPKTVSVPFPIDEEIKVQPLFLAGNDGIIHILWIDEDEALQYRRASSSTLGEPSYWIGVARLADSAVYVGAVVDSQGALHVGYFNNVSTDTNPAGLYYRRYASGRWSISKLIYSSNYFRSLDPENANVHLATSDASDMVNVYIAWDDRAQRRVFLAISPDGGQNWNEIEQIKGPEEFASFQTPHSVKIYTLENTGLLFWQVGDSSNQCVQYSQSIQNDGVNLGEPIKVLDENLGCPDETELFSLGQNLSLLLMKIQGGLSLIAWNGNAWSEPQLQNELLELFNPKIFDSILLGCHQFSMHGNMLYMVGCDQGSSRDIWFTSRALGTLENWYPSLSRWSSPRLVANTEQMISSLTSVTFLDSLHLFWAQTSRIERDQSNASIQYSRWSGEGWSSPRPIISNLTGKPLKIFVTKNQEGRLFIVWVDGKDGNIYFSWADSEGAGRSTEWIPPKIVPSASQTNSSPEMLVDGSGIIVIAYAIPVNENRGIYMIHSTDLGVSWSSPVRVFDAVSAGWEMIDNPRISLSGDGRLHLLFNRSSLRNDEQSMGLYYTQSIDGGNTWSEPELVREGFIIWSDIITLNPQDVHRIWQEKNGLEDSYIDQPSSDGGATWEVPVKIISANEETTKVSIATDEVGNFYLVQLAYGEGISLHDWNWDGSRWILHESIELNLKGDGTRYSITNGVTSDGSLVVPILIENSDLTGNNQDELWGVYRILDLAENAQSPFLPVIPTSIPIVANPEPENVPPSPTEGVSTLANLDNPAATNRKNQVGLFLVGAILLLTVILIRPKRKN